MEQKISWLFLPMKYFQQKFHNWVTQVLLYTEFKQQLHTPVCASMSTTIRVVSCPGMASRAACLDPDPTVLRTRWWRVTALLCVGDVATMSIYSYIWTWCVIPRVGDSGLVPHQLLRLTRDRGCHRYNRVLPDVSFIYVYICIYIYTWGSAWGITYIYILKYMCICTYTCMYMYTCMYVYM